MFRNENISGANHSSESLHITSLFLSHSPPRLYRHPLRAMTKSIVKKYHLFSTTFGQKGLSQVARLVLET